MDEGSVFAVPLGGPWWNWRARTSGSLRLEEMWAMGCRPEGRRDDDERRGLSDGLRNGVDVGCVGVVYRVTCFDQ